MTSQRKPCVSRSSPSLGVHRVRSAYYDDPAIFPAGSIELDHALLMREIHREWHSKAEPSAEKRGSQGDVGPPPVRTLVDVEDDPLIAHQRRGAVVGDLQNDVDLLSRFVRRDEAGFVQ